VAKTRSARGVLAPTIYRDAFGYAVQVPAGEFDTPRNVELIHSERARGMPPSLPSSTGVQEQTWRKAAKSMRQDADP
jgi:hypothetical protein